MLGCNPRFGCGGGTFTLQLAGPGTPQSQMITACMHGLMI
jgi:hypothetical protein